MTDEASTLLFLGDVVPHKAIRFTTRYKTVTNPECPIVLVKLTRPMTRLN